jgi:hypothetical protein
MTTNPVFVVRHTDSLVETFLAALAAHFSRIDSRKALDGAQTSRARLETLPPNGGPKSGRSGR